MTGDNREFLQPIIPADVNRVPEARSRWNNPHFVYTHGYGLVMADANRVTSSGLPILYVQDAPATVKTASLKLTRPELYFGEIAHEPVFVNTAQQEFDYPSGADSRIISPLFAVPTFAARLQKLHIVHNNE